MSARRKLLAIDDPLEVGRPAAPAPPPVDPPLSPEAVVARRALFVRLQVDEADAVARAAFELRVTKQELIGALVQRHVDARSPEGLAALRELLRQVRR
jgi:hypothetical protein